MAIATILLAGMGTARMYGNTEKKTETSKKNLPDDDSAQKTTSHEQTKYLPTVIYSPAVTVTDNDLGLEELFAEGDQDINHKFYVGIFNNLEEKFSTCEDQLQRKALTIEDWQTFQKEIDSNRLMQHAMEYAPKLYQNWHKTIKIRAHKISQQLIDQKLQEITDLLEPYVNGTKRSIEDWDNQKGMIKLSMDAVNSIIDEGSDKQKANNSQTEKEFLLIDQIFEEKRKRKRIDDILSEYEKNITEYECESAEKHTIDDQLTLWPCYGKKIIEQIKQLREENIEIEADGSARQKENYDKLKNKRLEFDNNFLANIDEYIPSVIGDGDDEKIDPNLSYQEWEAKKDFLNQNCRLYISNLEREGNDIQQGNIKHTLDRSKKINDFFEKKIKEAEEQLALCNKILKDIQTTAKIENLEDLHCKIDKDGYMDGTPKQFKALNKIKKEVEMKEIKELYDNSVPLMKNHKQLKGYDKFTNNYKSYSRKTYPIFSAFYGVLFNKNT